MLKLIAVLFLALPVLAQEEGPKPVDPAKKQTAVSELTRAFDKDGGPEARAAAIGRAQEVVDPEVIALVRKGLDDKDARVLEAAVTALGRMKHKHALEALHAFLKRERKKLEENDLLYPLVLKEIGRHGDESSLPLLADAAFDQRAYATAQARIMALGNIRSTKSIDALIDMSKKVGVHRMDGLRQDMRLALARLTGRDLGAVSTQWLAWWQDNKKGFEVPVAPQKLDPVMERQWARYWGDEAAAGEGEGGGQGGNRRGRRQGGGEGGGEAGGAGGGAGGGSSGGSSGGASGGASGRSGG